MCGIVGYVTASNTADDLQSNIGAMTNRMLLRGPDSGDVWWDPEAGCALGHRRLAVIDLSEQGAQPMHSFDGRYVTTFNGEIYNFQDIRRQLSEYEGLTFRGSSDTEVMLSAFVVWGIEDTIQKLVGMFAFAVWDRQERSLYLVRDRMGEKPLYFGWVGKSFVFGSTLRALSAHPDWQQSVDRHALSAYLRYNYVPTPLSIFADIYKVPPGCLVKLDKWKVSAEPTVKKYWSVEAHFHNGLLNPLECTEIEAVDTLERLLRGAVAGQMISDVPLGAFLSGGIDSSTIVALMQDQSWNPVKTFTIAFDEPEYNEAPHAAAVARHLGTDHTERRVTAKDALAVVPMLPAMYDEPFSDMSQIPTYLVSRTAREHVTVSLSGDGGDELFFGYQRYFDTLYVHQHLNRMPRVVQSISSEVVKKMPASLLKAGFKGLRPFLPSNAEQHDAIDKLRRLAWMMPAHDINALYLSVMSHWQTPASIVKGGTNGHVHIPAFPDDLTDAQIIQRCAGFDLTSYLPDDILVKVDRASMQSSLEARVPLLDHRIVEFMLRLPLALKYHPDSPKWLLRQVLHRFVPPALIDRPKMGFSVPMERWLRTDLRDWAGELLEPRRLKEQGFFNPILITRRWQAHLDGHANWQHHLWDVLVFQAWLEAETTA